jgi:outer membrane autotransporter protein
MVDFGLDADIDRNITVFADYEANAGQDNYFGQSIQAGVKVGF